MGSDAQRAACKRYYQRTKDTRKAIMIRLDKEADKDVISAMEASGNKADYIRRLVRADISRRGKTDDTEWMNL